MLTWEPLPLKLAGIPEDAAYVAVMSKPGFKVLHIQDIDFTSNCREPSTS